MIKKRFLQSIILVSILFFTPLFADDKTLSSELYIQNINPDILMLLPPPPADGSAEQKAEIRILKHVTDNRTDAEKAAAQSQIILDFFTFSPVIGDWFKKESLPKTYAFFLKVEKTTKTVTNIGKNHWKRKRPFDYEPSINVLKKETSLSYPSGHSSRGMVYASVLSEIFPDKKDELLKFGFNVGWNRIIAGVHYPSDVMTGRITGMAIARDLMKNQVFLKDLEEVKKEIKSVMPR